MNRRIKRQIRLQRIVRALDEAAIVGHEFASGDFAIKSAAHRDISMAFEFLDDHDDSEVSAAIKALWDH